MRLLILIIISTSVCSCLAFEDTITIIQNDFIYESDERNINLETQCFWLGSAFSLTKLEGCEFIRKADTGTWNLIENPEIKYLSLFKTNIKGGTISWETNCLQGDIVIKEKYNTDVGSQDLYLVVKNEKINVINDDLIIEDQISMTKDSAKVEIIITKQNLLCASFCRIFIEELKRKFTMELKDNHFYLNIEIPDTLQQITYYYEIGDQYESMLKFPKSDFLVHQFIESIPPLAICYDRTIQDNLVSFYSTLLGKENKYNLNLYISSGDSEQEYSVDYNQDKDRFILQCEIPEDSLMVDAILTSLDNSNDIKYAFFNAYKDSSSSSLFIDAVAARKDTINFYYSDSLVTTKFFTYPESLEFVSAEVLCSDLNQYPMWVKGVFSPLSPQQSFKLNYLKVEDKIEKISLPVNRTFLRKYWVRVLWHHWPGIIHSYSLFKNDANLENKDWWFLLPAAPFVGRSIYEFYYSRRNDHKKLNRISVDVFDTVLGFLEFSLYSSDLLTHEKGKINGYGAVQTTESAPWIPPDPPIFTKVSSKVFFLININLSF